MTLKSSNHHNGPTGRHQRPAAGRTRARSQEPAGSRDRGTVKWFSRAKGYGFIQPEDGGPEVFVHYADIDGEGYRNLVEDEHVEYDLLSTPKGPKAGRVRPVGG